MAGKRENEKQIEREDLVSGEKLSQKMSIK